MIKKRLAAQIAVYVTGLFILAFGVVFSINSHLGISPVNALPFAVSLVSGVRMGICVTVFFLTCIALQIALLRKKFQWINLTQIAFSFLFGYFVDVAMFIKGDFSLAFVAYDFGLPSYLGQLAMLAISLVLIATGLTLYLEAKLISLPSEGFILALIHKFPALKFHRVKIAMDCVLVSLAILTTLVFMGGIYGAREGTVIAAVFVGKLIPYTRKVITRVLDKAGFYPNE
ncbi:MAG: DUF6198 family protein [Defluviitaleaceae bacterium]|nr:DUF6198 family protein [Defluviitaleaceae bacterium]